MDYKLVICGGTFDRLHVGHKAFLDFVFSKSEKAVIGITSDVYVTSYKPQAAVLPYQQRKQAVIDYLTEKNLLGKAYLYEINDVIGPGADPTLPLEAIIATEDTKKGAKIINTKRQEQNLVILPIVVMPLVGDISSTAIRQGIMDTTGDFFVDEHWSSRIHTLPPTLRKELQKPLGTVLQEIPLVNNATKIITVGDVTTKNFLTKNLHPQLAVIDFVIERQPTQQSIKDLGFSGEEMLYPVSNLAATLTPSLWEVIRLAFSDTAHQSVIVIDGEEDLAVIPLLLSAPLGWTIYYGQPRFGLVEVPVTLNKKRTTYELLKRFL